MLFAALVEEVRLKEPALDAGGWLHNKVCKRACSRWVHDASKGGPMGRGGVALAPRWRTLSALRFAAAARCVACVGPMGEDDKFMMMDGS
jgi:hypothetical protein